MQEPSIFDRTGDRDGFCTPTDDGCNRGRCAQGVDHDTKAGLGSGKVRGKKGNVYLHRASIAALSVPSAVNVNRRLYPNGSGCDRVTAPSARFFNPRPL